MFCRSAWADGFFVALSVIGSFGSRWLVAIDAWPRATVVYGCINDLQVSNPERLMSDGPAVSTRRAGGSAERRWLNDEFELSAVP